MIEFSDGLGYAGQQMEILPAGDILAFRHLAVDHAVAIEKDGVQDFWRDAHAAMIAISC